MRPGSRPIKLNCVVQRGVNEDGLLDLVDFARREGLSLRCIEYMDVGATNGWRMADVVSGEEILERVSKVYPLLEEAPDPTAVARTLSLRRRRRRPRRDHLGEPPVLRRLHPRPARCRRQALHVPVRDRRHRPARTAAIRRDDDALRRIIADRWKRRDDRYSELRGLGIAEGERIEMSYIGG